MMIYGVGLHVLPRFSGFPLYSERVATWQFYVANAGLWLMVLGCSCPRTSWSWSAAPRVGPPWPCRVQHHVDRQSARTGGVSMSEYRGCETRRPVLRPRLRVGAPRGRRNLYRRHHRRRSDHGGASAVRLFQETRHPPRGGQAGAVWSRASGRRIRRPSTARSCASIRAWKRSRASSTWIRIAMRGSWYAPDDPAQALARLATGERARRPSCDCGSTSTTCSACAARTEAMKVELLVSEWCASCHQAEKVWRQVSEERDSTSPWSTWVSPRARRWLAACA